MGEHPVVPDYTGPCLCNVVPALLERSRRAAPPWLPAAAGDAAQVVLLVLDGLGWEQLQARRELAPTLCGMVGGPIASVVPSTTATALTSIASGMTPGEHGVIGYRIDVHGQILNVLRWQTERGDARRSIPPAEFQPVPPFLGMRPPVVTKAEFNGSGFSGVHLAGSRFRGWRVPSTLVVEIGDLLRAGEPFVYAYYDGVDKVAHEYGLEAHYDAELAFADRLVADVRAVLPPGAVLVVTSDHGQVDVGERVHRPAPEVLDLVASQSGEGRFRWLHAKRGRAGELLEVARAAHSDEAWVVSREETVLGGWFGPHLSEAAAVRLGDVALCAREPMAFEDPGDTGPFQLVARHGSLTAAEMLVPLLAAAPEEDS